MQLLLILLHKHQNTEDVNWAVTFPAFIAIVLFFGNILWEHLKKVFDTKKRLSNHLIETCDKMIRCAINCEYTILESRYCYAKWMITKDAHDLEYYHYYFKKAYDFGTEYDYLNTELKKSVLDLNNSWFNKSKIQAIISLMKIIVLIRKKTFDQSFGGQIQIEEIEKVHKNLQENIQEDIIFTGVGFYLVMLQKAIDPNSPSLYMNEEKENDFLTAMNQYTTKKNFKNTNSK